MIPHKGPNQTRRRPIYIECRGQEIVLQPEGVVMTVDDFYGPNTPGNPLAAALRATREYLSRRGHRGPTPYPLLMVRPDAAQTYYIARQAIDSLGPDFGYELIQQDWKLKFLPADPILAQTQERAVREARVLQQSLAAAYRSNGRGSSGDGGRYIASPNGGGIVRDQGSDLDSFGSGGNRRSGGRTHRGGGADRGANGGRPRSGPRGPNDHSGSGPRANSGPNGTGGPSQKTPVFQRPTGDQQQRSQGNRPGGSTQPGSPGGGSTGQRGSSGPGGSGQGNSGQSSPTGPGRPSSQSTSLAVKRGENWGLPNAAASSVPITRPIVVHCYANRVAIVSSENSRTAKFVALRPQTVDSVDELVTAVWEHMKGWGIAGKGMYWRPTLSFYVHPGGEQRFADLAGLLENSGLRVRRKQ